MLTLFFGNKTAKNVREQFKYYTIKIAYYGGGILWSGL